MAEQFPILDVTDWSAVGDEAMGSKAKVWLEAPDGVRWLFKQQHRAYTGDDWSEKVAAEVASVLDIPHATVELSSRRGERGIISRDLVRQLKADELVPGNRLLIDNDPTYPRGESSYRKSDHTLDRVFAALGRDNTQVPDASPDDPAVTTSQSVFVGYLLLDALIGNTDRHPENWAVLLFVPPGSTRTAVICPTYDHSACLGFNLDDNERDRRLTTRDTRYAVSAYVRRAKSALYLRETDTKPLSPLDAFRVAAGRYPAAAQFWLARLKRAGDDRLTDIVQRVPSVIMTEIARRFARTMLVCNRANLLAEMTS